MISICFILFLLISILTSSYGQVTCPSGWSQYGGSCYLLFPTFLPGSRVGTWDQCNAYCISSYPGATMLCVNNADEHAWILQRSYDYYVQYYWIGYTDMPPYGGGKGTKQYGWVTGCSSTYTNWGAGQPKNANNNQDYVNVYNGLWEDKSPYDLVFCGCEYTQALTTTPSSRPSTVPSFRPSVAPSSVPTSSPSATPSFSSSEGSVSE
jgi:hypothetical protein